MSQVEHYFGLILSLNSSVEVYGLDAALYLQLAIPLAISSDSKKRHNGVCFLFEQLEAMLLAEDDWPDVKVGLIAESFQAQELVWIVLSEPLEDRSLSQDCPCCVCFSELYHFQDNLH